MNAGAVLLKMALRTSIGRTQRTEGCGASKTTGVSSAATGDQRKTRTAGDATRVKNAPSPQDAGAIAPKRQINSTASAD